MFLLSKVQNVLFLYRMVNVFFSETTYFTLHYIKHFTLHYTEINMQVFLYIYLWKGIIDACAQANYKYSNLKKDFKTNNILV